MKGAACFLLLLQLFCVVYRSWAQHSPYSLQAAVDELHRREAAKYPLNAPPSQQHYYNGALGTTAEQDYWDDDTDFPTNNYQTRNRHRLNKVLAKYLERENYDSDHGGLGVGPFDGYEFDEDNNQLILEPDEKKRSSYFRERDSKYDLPPTSAFRERETQSNAGTGIAFPERSELTEQFLREIENAQEREREERYKDALRNLWEKYQQQENEIEGDLLEERKRVRMPPYFMLMQKKRSYPVLPWLPYSAERKKRFPVAKRSTKHFSNDISNLGKTDDKVAKELSELFGSSASSTNDEKKKRSVDEQTRISSTRAPVTTLATSEDMHLEIPSKKDNATETVPNAAQSEGGHNHHQHGHEHAHSEHMHKEHKHRKRSDHHGSRESHEEEEEGSESEEHEEEEGEEEDEEEFEEDAEERKKKRDLSSMKRLNLELLRGEPQSATRLSNLRKKKSVDWSKYFGLDRKKKSVKGDNKSGVYLRKRSASDDESDNNEQEKKKRELDPEKIDNMDRKLQSIEDFIIDETIKYTGAHEGIANPDKIRRLKDHVLSRLATAYSLEKMRRALEKLRQSVEAENHLLRNVIEPEDQSENELKKRLSVKKEQATLHELENIGLSSGNEKSKEIHSNAMMSASSADTNNKHVDSNGNDDSEQIKKHKKKRNGYLRYPEVSNDFSDVDENIGVGHYEPLNDAYLGNKNYIIGSNQCPIIESMAERCRGVDLLSGDINQELLPICGVHQICYLCGTSQSACDYQYLTEAESICGNNNDCLAAARSVLLILRGSPGPLLGPRECLKNTCLHSAMREIGL